MINKAGINLKKKTVWISLLGDNELLELPFSRIKKAPIRKVKITIVEKADEFIRLRNTLGQEFVLTLENFKNYKKLNARSKKAKVKSSLVSKIREVMELHNVSLRELALLNGTSPARISEALNKNGSSSQIDRLLDISETLGIRMLITYKDDEFQLY